MTNFNLSRSKDLHYTKTHLYKQDQFQHFPGQRDMTVFTNTMFQQHHILGKSKEKS